MSDAITQSAPYPWALHEIIEHFTYKPGWTFALIPDLDRGQGSHGTTLDITSCTFNSYHPDRGNTYSVHHYVIVPPASFNERSWRWWLLQRLIEIETHEAMEFFHVGDARPYAPSHGPGNDPYMVAELSTDIDQRTSFRGNVNPARGAR